MSETAFLARAIADFRRYSDEPSVQPKYTDAVLIGMIEQAYATIIGEVRRNNRNSVVAKFNITYVYGTEAYLLPPLIGSIEAIYHEDTDTGAKVFYYSQGRRNPYGRGVWVEGRTLKTIPYAFENDYVLTVEYVPSHTAHLHYGTFTASSTTSVTLGASPTAGSLDTNLQAYAGCVLRILGSSDASYDYVQERTITAYDRTTRVATLDLALDPSFVGIAGTHNYEIAPPIYRGLDHVVALYLARWIAAVEGDPRKERAMNGLYAEAMRTLRLDAYYFAADDAHRVQTDAYNRPRTTRRPGGVV